MKFLGFILFLSVLISFDSYAFCGRSGRVQDRLKDCKSESTKEPDFQVVSITKSGQYLYHSNLDIILTPAFLKSSQVKCISPYRRLTRLKRIFKKNLRFEKIPRGSFRCYLPDASRYMLLENEILL